MMRCITAIWPAGPPNDRAATRAHTFIAFAERHAVAGQSAAWSRGTSVTLPCPQPTRGATGRGRRAPRRRAPGAPASSSRWPAAMPAITLRMPAVSSRPYLPSLRSMSWMISPMASSAAIVAGSPRAAAAPRRCSGRPQWVYSPSNMSKRTSPGCGSVARAGHELEARLRIDEAADQPGRGDAVDLHAPRASPRPAAHCVGAGRCGAESDVGSRSRRRPSCNPASRPDTRLLSAGFAARRRRRNRSRLVSRSCLRRRTTCAATSAPRHRPTGRRRDAPPSARGRRRSARSPRCARRSNRSALQLVVGQAFDQLAPRTPAPRRPASDDLLGQPGEVLAASRRWSGSAYTAFLTVTAPSACSAPPHLDPGVGGLGRQLMNQQTATASPSRVVSRHCSPVSYQLSILQHLYHFSLASVRPASVYCR